MPNHEPKRNVFLKCSGDGRWRSGLLNVESFVLSVPHCETQTIDIHHAHKQVQECYSHFQQKKKRLLLNLKCFLA